MTACHDTFGTPELAEIVFLELSMRDILCGVQQVCQQWRAIVGNSLHLQQALFLRPVPVAPLTRNWTGHQFDGTEGNWVWPEGAAPSPIYEHPLLSRLAGGVVGATWRKSLATQPPIAGVLLSDDSVTRDPDLVEAQDGVTLNDIFADLRFLRLPTAIVPEGSSHWRNYSHASQLRQLRSTRNKKAAGREPPMERDDAANSAGFENTTPSHKVFGVPELSEAIFLELDKRDLLCGV